MIVLLSPQHVFDVGEFMARNGYTHREEIEPKAGCRRFRLTLGN